jgi:hypothetical protein
LIETTELATTELGFRALSREVAPSAFYNAGHDFDLPKCHPNTRVAVLKGSKIGRWAVGLGSLFDVDVRCRRCWEVIYRKINCRMVPEGEDLLASFFFFRSDPLRNNFKRFIATLAYDIIQSVPDCRPFIERAVESDPHIFSRSLDAQILHLILKPLSQVHNQGLGNPFLMLSLSTDLTSVLRPRNKHPLSSSSRQLFARIHPSDGKFSLQVDPSSQFDTRSMMLRTRPLGLH